MDTSSNLPKAFITIQPQSNFRFRYRSEIREKHGLLGGRVYRTFPTISLQVPEGINENEFFVTIMLFEHVNGNNEKLILSPHYLVNSETKKVFIIEKMEKIKNNEYEFALKNHFILRETRDNSSETSYTTYKELEEAISNFSDLPIEIENKMSNTVCLGFSILTKKDEKHFLYCSPILSEPVNNAPSITINKICSVKCTSGDNVTILVNSVTKGNVQILIYEEKDGIRTKAYEIEENKLEIHKNVAISFNIPEFTSTTQKLRIRVIRPKNNEESDFVTIIYKHQNEYDTTEPLLRKRARRDSIEVKNLEYQYDHIGIIKAGLSNREEEASSKIEINSITTALQDTHISQEKLCIQRKGSEKKFCFDENECLDAIKSDTFLQFYDKIENYERSNPHSIITKKQNSQRISLLHYVCYWNKSIELRPLIGMGYEVYKQDNELKTPLHIALSRNNQECINIFVELLQDPEPFDDVNLANSLKRMLEVYDDQGFTVLHRAVLKNQLKLMESILGFCNRENSNLYQNKTLRDGDTILHLALSRGLIEMGQLIIKYDPEAVFFSNYKGMIIIEDENAMQELGLKTELEQGT